MKFEINDEKLVKFGNFIKKLRFESNYTLEQLKRYTGINIADLNRLENDGRKDAGLKEKVWKEIIQNICKMEKIQK